MNAHPHGEQLSAYLDGMLDVAQMRSVAAHLAGCSQCDPVLEGLRGTKRSLGTMASPPVPAPEFWADAYRRMRVQDALPARNTPSDHWNDLGEFFRDPQRRWSAGLAAAAVAAAAIAAPLMYSQHPASPPIPRIIGALAPDSVDVSSLVQAHTESAAREPLADTDRQDVIALDDSFASDDAGSSSTDQLDAGSDAPP